VKGWTLALAAMTTVQLCGVVGALTKGMSFSRSSSRVVAMA
jgi:hypothetical protein